MPSKLADMVEEDVKAALDAASSGGVLERGARQVRRMIRSRTRRGIDRFGNRFAAYAPSTARQKGRFSPVTLTETGQMLEGLSVRTNEEVSFDERANPESSGQFRGAGGRFVSRDDVSFGASVNLKGSRNRRIGRFHIEGTRKMPSRDFMGVTAREKERVSETVGVDLRSEINRVLPTDRRRRVEVQLF